jgi:hypothetical protein
MPTGRKETSSQIINRWKIYFLLSGTSLTELIIGTCWFTASCSCVSLSAIMHTCNRLMMRIAVFWIRKVFIYIRILGSMS